MHCRRWHAAERISRSRVEALDCVARCFFRARSLQRVNPDRDPMHNKLPVRASGATVVSQGAALNFLPQITQMRLRRKRELNRMRVGGHRVWRDLLSFGGAPISIPAPACCSPKKVDGSYAHRPPSPVRLNSRLRRRRICVIRGLLFTQSHQARPHLVASPYRKSSACTPVSARN